MASEINSILLHLNSLSSYQLNTSVASIVYKGKEKPVFKHKSYRQVRVTPLIARIIDEHLRPNIINITKPLQNSSQYGFTAKVSYLLGALQRHETETFCIDMKTTFFGCSLDGQAAFEIVNRTILLRELYCAGETGQYWSANNFSYQNTNTRIKMNGKLSKEIFEEKGVKQGQIKSSDHYKIYINPLLDMLDSANLGVWIGPVNVGHSACADDVFIMTDTQSKMQALLDLAEHYGQKYEVIYGADKTKITVIGSDIDRRYYSDVSPWKINDQIVNVTDENEHLGQIISATDPEQKNVDLRISKARGSLFSLIGPAFQSKSLLNPALKYHLFRTYVSPVLKCGLSSFVLRKTHIQPLAMFQRKALRGILSLSCKSNIPALHFLLGELPIEGQLHRDIFALFYSIWINPDTKIFKIVKHLLEYSQPNSRTWSANLRYLAEKYDLPNPLEMLKSTPQNKSTFKELVHTKICSYYEKELREMAARNSRMEFFNVSLTSLRGSCHQAIRNILTTYDVKKCRFHLKMLSGDYLTYSIKAKQSGGSPDCRLCVSSVSENIMHMLVVCTAYSEIRERTLTKYIELSHEIKFPFTEISDNNENLS